MYTAMNHIQNIEKIRRELSDPTKLEIGFNGKVGTTRRAPAHTRITLSVPDMPLTLIFNSHDMYIEGFINKNGEIFLTKGSTYNISTRKLSYSNEYGDLGLDRTAAFKLTLEDVEAAVTQLWNAKTLMHDDAILKTYIWKACVGFSECARFGDVMTQVCRGTDITDLDWDKHTLHNEVRMRKCP